MEALKLIAILSKWINLETNTDEMYNASKIYYINYQMSLSQIMTLYFCLYVR